MGWMYTSHVGPITSYSFGRFIINGSEHAETSDGQPSGAGKDICLAGTQVTAWQERKGHVLSREMLKPALVWMPDLLIIGCGAQARLQCPHELIIYLKRKGIERVEVMPTAQACALYNDAFKRGERVMLLAHGTC